ncbi:MAG: alpha/beta hydrolase [Muribaculaceae bacterium]|nr:alpha/beta hydrolase [Muribaculaceae bacterium]
MKSRFALSILTIFLSLFSSNIHALSGKWRGELRIMQQTLPLVFNFNENDNGIQEATLDSPLQNVKGLPLEILFVSADSINLECKRIGAAFSGVISDDSIIGKFSQRGFQIPLTLTPELSLEERRPQTPQPPFPYIEKDTFFISENGIRLYGTLTLPHPEMSSLVPVVVMATGSGPQNRDEEIFEHRPFAVIADYLARNGIASFRYDDRGTAASEGDYSAASIKSFQTDLENAFQFVKSFPNFSKAGILGHSEGGTLAVISEGNLKPDFIISLAGMVTPAKNTLIEQNIHHLDRLGITGEQKDASVRLINTLFSMISEQYKAGKREPIDVDMICREYSQDIPASVLESVKRNNSSRNDYFDSLVSLDPTDNLKKIDCPVLAINGRKDVQVNPDTNLKAFADYVKNVEVRPMEGLNHLLQHCSSGEISEYGAINETISPEVLEMIVGFIKDKN